MYCVLFAGENNPYTYDNYICTLQYCRKEAVAQAQLTQTVSYP